MGVYVATDAALYETEVFAASHSPGAPLSSISSTGHGSVYSSSHGHGHGKERKHAKLKTRTWEDRLVLLLLGIRLRPDGVNPVCYKTIKMFYTLPQSVGLAGGRPSSSYYFVGVEGDGIFYLDPHHLRPVVPLRPFVPRLPPPPPSTHVPRQIASRRPRGVRARRSTNEFEFVSGHGHGYVHVDDGGRARVLTLLAAPARHQSLGRLPARCRAAARRQAFPARGGGALHAHAQPGRAAYLPLRAGAQDAAVGARPGHAHWIRVSRLGGGGTFAEEGSNVGVRLPESESDLAAGAGYLSLNHSLGKAKWIRISYICGYCADDAHGSTLSM
ncbi:hypothetical protein DFH08DRAFT_1044498 [Mycena albidolilacea]|uniref:Cysteine protease n=1 Tax=Mycena albidolilacea TaxID=1033008 RepID=A0AAD6Z9W4_9AGAR|nr:hypothetical protein DFH08DRAFT_1044498 [Mycena albidolilacea]